MKFSLANFEKIVTQNEQRIFSAIYAYVGNYEDALDLTQETFIQAYRAISKFRGESSISTWLYRIAVNLCKKHLSKKSRWSRIIAGSSDGPDLQPVALEVSAREPLVDERLLKQELSQTVQTQILSLPLKYRTVIVLKYLQDLSYEEIAEVLQVNVGTVKSRLNRAKQILEGKLNHAMQENPTTHQYIPG